MRVIQNENERKEYWYSELVRRGFCLHEAIEDWSHFTNGLFSVSFSVKSIFLSTGLYAGIVLSINVSSEQVSRWVNTVSVNIVDVEGADIHHVLDCLVKPELLPTCIGIPWFSKFLESWMAAR